jgi:integrase
MSADKGNISIADLHREMVEIKELLKASLDAVQVGSRIVTSEPLRGVGATFSVEQVSDRQVTLEHSLSEYLSFKKVEVSPRHFEATKLILRKFNERLPGAKLIGVGKEDVRGYKAEFLASGVAPKTVNLHLSALSAFFKWGIDNGLIADNPAKGLTLTVNGAASSQRDAFSDEQIKDVFTGLLKGRETAAKAWVPLVMLFSGCRPEEAAQLRVKDVREESGVWVFDFATMDDGLRRKTEASRRLVPIHPRLWELGLKKLMEPSPKPASRSDELHAILTGDRALFRDLRMGAASRLSAAPGRFFNRSWLRKEKGIENKKLVMYSLRHSVTTKLLHAGVAESLISQLVGHTNSSMTSGRYGKQYPLKQMEEALEKLDWEV